MYSNKNYKWIYGYIIKGFIECLNLSKNMFWCSRQWLDFPTLEKYLQLEKDFFFVGIAYVYICICGWGWGTKTGIFSGNGEWVSVGLSGAMKLILNAALTGE